MISFSNNNKSLLLASVLHLTLSISTDAFVHPSPWTTRYASEAPYSILNMGYLDALSGSSGINNRGSNGGGGMGSNPPGGSGGGVGNNPPGGGGMGSNPPPTTQAEMPVTAPPPMGSSNADYDQRRQASEIGRAGGGMDSGPSYSSYMDGRSNAATATNGRGDLGMGGSHSTNNGMNNGGMNGHNNMAGIGGGGVSGSHQQNGYETNRNGIGGDINGMNHGDSMRDNLHSRSNNPYVYTNSFDSNSATRQGGNMNANGPLSVNYSLGNDRNYDGNLDRRGHEMNHNRNMDIDRRPGYTSNGYMVRLRY